MITHTINRGDIFFADLRNYFPHSQVQCGVRPVVAVSCQENLSTSPVITVLPLSSKAKSLHLPTHVTIETQTSGLRYPSTILCEQPLSVDKFVLERRVGHLSKAAMELVDEALRIQLCL